MNYQDFQEVVRISWTDICRQALDRNRETIRVKKEDRVIKNLGRIFETALTISNRKGFQAMSIRDLSAGTGLSMGALYAYFSGKEELLEMLQRLGRSVTSGILHERLKESPDPWTKLGTAVRTHLYLSEAMQPWFYFSYMETKNLTEVEKKQAMDAELHTEELFANILREGQRAGDFVSRDAKLSAAVLKAILQDWYLKRRKYHKRNISVDEYADFVLDFLESYHLSPHLSDSP